MLSWRLFLHLYHESYQKIVPRTTLTAIISWPSFTVRYVLGPAVPWAASLAPFTSAPEAYGSQNNFKLTSVENNLFGLKNTVFMYWGSRNTEVENNLRATRPDVLNEVGTNTVISLVMRALLPRVRRVDNILWLQVWKKTGETGKRLVRLDGRSKQQK